MQLPRQRCSSDPSHRTAVLSDPWDNLKIPLEPPQAPLERPP